MSLHIDSNLRLEFGRQRQAELLQRAQRDRLERGSRTRSPTTPARCHARRGQYCCGATARLFQGRLDDHRARTPGSVAPGGRRTSSPPWKARASAAATCRHALNPLSLYRFFIEKRGIAADKTQGSTRRSMSCLGRSSNGAGSAMVHSRPNRGGRPARRARCQKLGCGSDRVSTGSSSPSATRSSVVRGVTYGTFAPGRATGRGSRPATRSRRDFAAMAAQRHQRRAHLHRAARAGCSTLALTPRSLGDGRACPGSSTSPSSTTAGAPPSIEARVRGQAARLRRPSRGPLLRGRQRDPDADRALARPPPGRALPRAALRRGQGARTRRRSSPTSTTRPPSTSSCRSSTSSRFNVYLETRREARAPTSRGCRTSPATGRCCSPRWASTAAATGATQQAEALDWQVRRRLRGRLRRRVRLRLDRRVAPRRRRGRRLGLRPDRPRAPAQAGAARPCAARSPTRRSRRPRDWPRVSVVVCTYNGARDDRATASTAWRALDYPDYEVIVVDDGSTDGTAEIAARASTSA